jgi:replicative DNA helicase Mcm
MTATEEYDKFFKNYYWDQILDLKHDYPERKTLIVDFKDLNRFNIEAAQRLLNQPEKELISLTDTLSELDIPADGAMPWVRVAIRGYEDTISIQKIGRGEINKFISVEGRITRIAPKYQKLIEGAFKCQRCGEINFLSQMDGRFVEPYDCSACERKGPFILLEEQCIFEDQQTIALQDLYESAKPGQPLREIPVDLMGSDLIESIPGMGTECIITGTLKLAQKNNKNEKSSLFNNYILASHIEPKEAQMDLSISESEKREFRDLAANGDINQILIDSTAPDILGHAHIKIALICAIVSGSDKPGIREYINVILCGDPGTGKSALLKSIRALVPRAQFSAGKGSSVAGLTVAIVKDELSGSGYTAQAGALVLADRGLMVLDEVDKLEKEDFQALNTALEESFIEIHKGGINQKFNTRCSVIALCNPKNIRFDEYESLTKQIKIPADTLSRFDLIFKILDQPDPEKDKAIAEHQARQWEKFEDGSQEKPGEGCLSQERLYQLTF